MHESALSSGPCVHQMKEFKNFRSDNCVVASRAIQRAWSHVIFFCSGTIEESAMFPNKWFLFSIFFLMIIFSTSQATSPYYDTTSNLTHTCHISPMVVCVDINAVHNKTCADPKCLIYSGGNVSSCISPLIVSCSNTSTNISSNCTINGTMHSNTTIFTCNATWIYPASNKTSFCFNATSWNKTVCSQANTTCKINSSQCTLNPVVYLGGFFNLEGKDGYGNIPGAEIALNQINKDNTTLENITLSLVSKKSTQV